MELKEEDRVVEHNSYITTKKVLILLKELITGEKSMELEISQIEILTRIQVTFQFLEDAFEKVPGWLVSISTLNSMSNTISYIETYLTNFSNDKNQQHLNSSLEHIEVLLTFLPQLLIIKTPSEIEGIKSTVTNFRKSIGQYLSNLDKEVYTTRLKYERNSEKLTELSSSIENQKSRTDSIISDFQNQFLQSQSQRTEDFNSKLVTFENEIIEFNEESIDQKNSLLEKYTNEFTTLSNTFNEQLDTQQNNLESLKEDSKAKFNEEMEKIREMNKEAEKILGIMSMKGLAQGYQKIANREGWQSFGWNIASVASLIVVLILGYTFFINHEGIIAWSTLISRIVITAVGLTLFTYCAKQATNHRAEEQHNRKMELELASLDPYLKDLEPENQKDIKQKLVDKYFGIEQLKTSKQKDNANHEEYLQKIMDNPQFITHLVDKISKTLSEK